MSEQRAPVPEPTEIAGRYQVIKKLGAGAFGTVYKAKDKILGRMVAIKTIRLEGIAAAGASLEELMDRFKREAQVSAQLKHPNIVTIYDVGEAQGVSYLAMEFIDGVGLDRVIVNEGRLGVERAASLGAQVADALDFAHRNNVVHRDIKPANIMIEAGDRVKVTDFGIAKVTDSGEHLTMTGSLLGTPSYMSPEQARGAVLDGRSDLFSAGCVLYEMLAGKKAFRGDSITGLIFKIITEEPPSIREFDPAIPDEMVRILSKALAKSSDARYQTGREMADDLLALTRPGATPTLRQSEVATAPGMKVPSSPPTLNAPLTMQSVEPATLNAATAVRPRPAPPAQVSPPPPPVGSSTAARAGARPMPPPSRSNAGLLIGAGVGVLVLLLGGGAAAWYAFTRRPAAAGTLESAGSAGTPSTRTAATTPPSTLTADAGTATAAAPAAASGTETAPPATSAAVPAATLPAPPPTAAAGPTSRGAGRSTAGGEGAAVPPVTGAPETAPRGADDRFRFLDEEAPEGDGREAGEHAAEAYRGRQGRSSAGGFGTSRRFAQRERSPRDLRPVERPAVATLRHLMDREEAFKKKAGHYGTFDELARGMGLALDVPLGTTSFHRKGYRFDLTVESDGFRITAVPNMPGPRAFAGDDSGYIMRSGEE